MDEQTPKPVNVNINADPKVLAGRYANAFMVTSQERDVVIDFISTVNTNGQHNGALVSRLFLNRFTVDDLIKTLQENKRQWEQVRYEKGTDAK